MEAILVRKAVAKTKNKMNKVIAIGQSVIDIIHLNNKPIASFTGGRIANMAASLGRLGVDVEYVSECGCDSVGDMVVEFLNENHVGTESIDRFTDGQSQVSLFFIDGDGNERYMEYAKHPSTRFNVLWPKILENDIVVFGSYFALDEGPRKPLLELLNYAQERTAIIVYLPGFQPGLCSRITRVMPAVLENLEFADVVIARESDMQEIFGKSDSAACYKDHISFYCPNFLFTDKAFNIKMHLPGSTIEIKNGGEAPANKLGWDASLCAGFVYGMLKNDVALEGINALGEPTWRSIVETAKRFADDSAASGKNTISPNLR